MAHSTSGTSKVSVRSVESLIKHVNSESVELHMDDQENYAMSTEPCHECAQLVIALSTNRVLSSLTLVNVPSRLLVASAEALKINTTLTSLRVDRGGLCNATGAALAEALKVNASLTSFEVGAEGLGDVTGTALAEALKVNATLASFVVWGTTALGDATGTALAEALKVNATLTSFAVWGTTALSDATGTALAEALKVNASLTSFEMGRAGLGDTAGTALAEALKVNATLTSFAVWGATGLGDATGTALAEALKVNTALTSAYASSLMGVCKDDEALQQLMERNRDALAYCYKLKQLARPDVHNIGFTKLTSMRFRREIFRFFLPLGYVPAQAFVDMGMVAGSDKVLDKATAFDATSSVFISEPRPHDVQCGGTQAGSSKEPSQDTSEAPHPFSEPAVGVATSVATAAEKEDDDELRLAIQESLAEAVERANSDLAIAHTSSKASLPLCFNADGVVLLRLNCHARAAEVANALLTSPALAACRTIVKDAGCELQPEWANGTWILLPLTRELYKEAVLEASDIHILALSRDECAVREALKMVKYQKQPKLKAVDASERKSQDATAGSSNACSDPPDWTTYVEDDNVDIVVKRTFLECRPKVEDSSGPWSGP